MPGLELSVVIAALNEEKTVAEVLRRILLIFDRQTITGEIILVDGYSTDRTGAIAGEIAAADSRVRVIHLGREAPGNLGLSLREGFRSARAAYIVALDCDLSHDPDDIPRFYTERAAAHLVIGSRFTQGGRAELSLKRSLLSRGYNLFARGLLGGGIHDLTSGYRLYRKAMLDALDLQSRGFGLQVEIVAKAVAGGYTVKEIPIYYRRCDKKSNLIYRKQFASYMLPVIKGAAARWLGARPPGLT
jgi:dolichol-phosphate mannosyltransferase